MMTTAELIALRSRLITALANRHTVGAADAYVKALEAEVALMNFNSRKGSVRHLLALVDAALEARRQLAKTKQVPNTAPLKPQPLRGHSEIAIIDEAAFQKPVEPPPAPVEEPQTEVANPLPEPRRTPKGRRITHGRARKNPSTTSTD